MLFFIEKTFHNYFVLTDPDACYDLNLYTDDLEITYLIAYLQINQYHYER